MIAKVVNNHSLFRTAAASATSSERINYLKKPINQIGESNNPAWRTIYDMSRAERKPITSHRFQRRLCWFLVALISAIVVSVFFVSASLN